MTCDSILFCQIYYYRWKRGQATFGSISTPEERVPLLTSENHRAEDVVPAWLLVIRYFCALAFVVLVGVAAWWVTDNEEESNFMNPNQEKKWWFIQLLGWSSALLFFGARIPQILKKLQNTVRRVVPRIVFLCNIREYDLCVIDMCEEHGYGLSDYKWWLVSREYPNRISRHLRVVSVFLLSLHWWKQRPSWWWLISRSFDIDGCKDLFRFFVICCYLPRRPVTPFETSNIDKHRCFLGGNEARQIGLEG